MHSPRTTLLPATFCVIQTLTMDNVNNPDSANWVRYDYSLPNIEKFTSLIELKLSDPNLFSLNSEGFQTFSTIIKDTIEECFRAKDNFTQSRRNRLVNPWITSGIIESIKRKILLYEQWKNTVDKDNENGDQSYYNEYRDFRKILKHTLIRAKCLHMYRKFQNVQGDCKKTWKLII